MQALKGEPITIYGDEQQTRSFCCVDDLIEAMIRTMNTGDDFTGPVNIGNPGEFSMLELAQLIIKIANSKSVLKFLPLPADDPKHRQPDISLARASLDWQPVVPLKKGLDETIRYFRGVL